MLRKIRGVPHACLPTKNLAMEILDFVNMNLTERITCRILSTLQLLKDAIMGKVKIGNCCCLFLDIWNLLSQTFL